MRKILKILPIALLILCSYAVLMVGLHRQNVEINQLQEHIGILTHAEEILVSDLQTQQDAYEQLQTETDKTISDIKKSLSLLITFQDAGFAITEHTDLRELVALSKKVPYGSPFRHGHRYTSFYGPRDERFVGGNANGFHRGIDVIPIRWSDNVVNATANGTIIDYGVSETLGKYIVFETETGFRMKYGHLKTIFYQTEEGKVKDIPIQVGDRLGIMGETGSWATGPHLHLEMYVFDQKSDQWIELNPWRIIEYIGGELYE